MRTSSKLILGSLAASVLMGLAVGVASAGRLSTSNRNFRATWAALRFSEEETGIEAFCSVTLEGSFHSATIRKVSGALIGAVSRDIVKNESCTGGHATALQGTLPWHLTYEGFEGTLPNITTVAFLLGRYAFQVEVTAIFVRVICLYSDHGNPEETLMVRIARDTATGAVTLLTPEPNRRMGFTSGSGACPSFGRYDGSGQAFLLGNTARISVTLI